MEDLHQIYSRITAAHLLAVQVGSAEHARRQEQALFSYSEAIADAKERLRRHRLACYTKGLTGG
jgi:hypothetical protein